MTAIAGDTTLIVGIVVSYLLIVLAVGQYASRKTGDSREEYFMASRSFGTLVLLAALFATNMSAVVMIGAPSLAYDIGPNAYGYFVGLFVFTFPLFVMTIGHRVWLVGKRFDHITPGQVLNHRFQSSTLGVLAMLVFTFWTVPYLLVGIQGGGIAFEQLTSGAVPYWLGGLAVTLVVLVYVSTGGMRGTGWTNAFQGTVFVVALVGFAIVIPEQLGGFEAATRATLDVNPALVNRAGLPPLGWKTYLSVAVMVSIETFILPHLFIRYMTSRSSKQLRRTAVVYPIAILLSWGPAVMLGFWGLGQFPDIANPDFILPTLIQANFPTWLVGLALAGILAALMSTLDGQVLTLATMLTEDVLRPFTDIDERTEVFATRGFIVAILAVAYVAALLTKESIIDTTIFAFSGYALTFLPIVSGFYSERVTEAASGTGLVLGFVGLWAFHLGVLPGSLTVGFLPVIPVLVAQAVVMVAVALVTAPPDDERVDQYRTLFEGEW
ncbi:sodium:solute symporter family protein [Halarchaeum nitratireducens]|uniref:Sodium:solute symporter n=1 Tax=Halarchaeum nitratireducens TaxID=489913 RepID=A0A830G9D9_9EURY|nr:sodium:solute symporter family protein [Halarchaeum nitratireducens]GGN10370.1 sodium:solute symporter [Halarchaeum nitratireducens]